MDLGLTNRIALVIGSSHGLGRVVAETFLAEGAEVILCARDSGKLEAARQALSAMGGRVHAVVADVTRADDVTRIFQEAVRPLGHLDIVVNSAGRAEPFGAFLDLSDQDWMESYRLNCLSAVSVTRSAIPWLRKSSAGRVVNISSVPARQPGVFNPHYSAAKAALLNVNKHLANLLGRDGILVNAICPATLRGGGWERNVTDRARQDGISLVEAEQKMIEEEERKNSLGRIGTLEDVARLVAFLASPRTTFITGTCIDVDGGVVRSIF